MFTFSRNIFCQYFESVIYLSFAYSYEGNGHGLLSNYTKCIITDMKFSTAEIVENFAQILSESIIQNTISAIKAMDFIFLAIRSRNLLTAY